MLLRQFFEYIEALTVSSSICFHSDQPRITPCAKRLTEPKQSILHRQFHIHMQTSTFERTFIMQLFRTLLWTAMSFLMCFSISFAEYNSDKLGEAAGAYLAATDVMIKLSQSECGYAVKEKSKLSLEDTRNEILQYLNEQDTKEFNSYVESQDFKDQMAENNNFINGFMNAGKGEGELDDKTLCGMLLQNVALQYSAAKQKWEDAKELYAGSGEEQVAKEGFNEFKKIAELGDAEAQYHLGKIYSGEIEVNHLSVQRDNTEAAKWFLKAAEQGHADAQSDLALMYFSGRWRPFKLQGSYEMVAKSC